MSPHINQWTQLGQSNAFDAEADAYLAKALQEHEPDFGGGESGLNGKEGGDENILANGSSDSQRPESTAIPAGWVSGRSVYRVIWPAAGGLVMISLLAGGVAHYVQLMDQPAMATMRPGIPHDVPSSAMKSEPAENMTAETIGPETPTLPVVLPQAIATRAEQRAIEDENSTGSRFGTGTYPTVTGNRVIKASINDDVVAGYQAYLEENDQLAEHYYRRAVKMEPGNVDAWLGLGAVAQRQGKNNEASVCFEQALDLEPDNLLALAGLIDLAMESDPVAGEDQLRSLLVRQPEAAFLHAALGKLYAGQNQWTSAQQEYFQASRLEVNNAQYAFNLAVSLDHANKPEQAGKYYRSALELLAQRGGSVDRTEIETRIIGLEQERNK